MTDSGHAQRASRWQARWAAATLALTITAVGGVLTAAPSEAATTTVVADMGAPDGYPLVKSKFGVYNSCLVPLERYSRDINLINELQTDSLRIDGGLGGDPNCGWVEDPVSGTEDDLTYSWAETDEFAENLTSRSVAPYFSYGYQPEPLQVGGDWRSPPSDLGAWQSMLETFSTHYAASESPLGFQEIWNEPDFNDVFFTGDVDDYLEMYDTGVTGLRAGDPDAVVGGLSSAYRTDWIDPFLDHTEQNDLPVDFISFHQYPGNPAEQPAAIGTYLDEFVTRMAGRPHFHTSELHLNEYNSYPIDFPPGGSQDRFGLASSLLRDYRAALDLPALDKVSWAQFMDSGMGNFSGMITIDGQRKAVFNAAAIYGDMPVDRRELTIDGSGSVDGMASTDEHRSAVVLWNTGDQSQDVDMAFEQVPFETGTLQVYRIDADHSSIGDDPTTQKLVPTETHSDAPTDSLTWNGAIPAGGVVYLRIDDGTGLEASRSIENGSMVRTHSYRPDRTKTSYADVEPSTWTAYLGMGEETWADEQVAFTVEDVPAVLNVRTQVHGELQTLDGNSCACFRVDYETPGGYARSVLFHGPYRGGPDLYEPARSAPYPWGTQDQPDDVVAVPDLAEISIDLAEHAPPEWTGRIQLGFLLQNAGAGVRMTSQVGSDEIGSWDLDEGSGGTAFDRSGWQNTATLHDTTWTQGIEGNGLSFDGTSSWVEADTAAGADLGDSGLTVATWFRTDSAGTQRLLGQGASDHGDGYSLSIIDGALSFAVGADGVAADALVALTPPGFDDGQWHHVAAVLDGAGSARVYVDGVPRQLEVPTGHCGVSNGSTVSIEDCAGLSPVSSESLLIGAAENITEPFQGVLDEISVYGRPLTGAEVSTVSGQGDRAVARWSFDETAGTVAANEGTLPHHGQVTGGSWINGAHGNALALDGSTGSVHVGDVMNADFGIGDFAISTWFRTEGTSFQRLVSKGNHGNTDGYLLAVADGAVVLALGAGGTAAESVALNTPAGFDDGQWHHVIATVDRDEESVRVYLDGEPVPLSVGNGYCGTATDTVVSLDGCPVVASADAPLALGSYQGESEHFDGALDDTRLYDRAIRPEEVEGILAGD